MPSDFPDISKDLVDRLNELVPQRFPEIEWTERKIWFEAGKRSLVDFIESKYNDQNLTTLQKD
jgi:hypothetical protein|tara:strand:- start:2217 stop:2405 length:189 start_codon:yes stop_codon:yes gene_type:complete